MRFVEIIESVLYLMHKESEKKIKNNIDQLWIPRILIWKCLFNILKFCFISLYSIKKWFYKCCWNYLNKIYYFIFFAFKTCYGITEITHMLIISVLSITMERTAMIQNRNWVNYIHYRLISTTISNYFT